jgi:hypothetical protein
MNFLICECCGIEFDYKNKKQVNDKSPSIDRVNNNLGYIKDNVCIICCRCNRIKNDLDLIQINNIIKYIERKI